MQKKKTSILISAIFLMCVLSVAIGRASVGDITLDDASSFDGNLTVSGLGSFGSVMSSQGIYPLVTLYNGSLPQVVPIVYGRYSSPDVYDLYYKPYFANNDTFGSDVNMEGTFRDFDSIIIYGDKLVVIGRNSINVTWMRMMYLNGSVFKDWVQLFP